MYALYWTLNRVSQKPHINGLDIDDVNKALGEMHDAVESRVQVADYSKKLTEQQKIN